MPHLCWTGWDQSSGLLLGHLGPGGRGAGKKKKKKASQSPSGWYKREQLLLEAGVSSASLGIATSLGRARGAGRSGGCFTVCREPWVQGGLGTAVGEVQGHSARCILDLAQRPTFPTSGLTSGESRHTYQLVVGCDREIWGCGLRELRARPEGMAAGAVGPLGRAGGRAPEGEQPAEAASRETKPCACQVDWCWLCPWRAELGLWEPFSGRPHPRAGDQIFIHHPLLGSSIPGWAQSLGGVG